MAKVYYVKTDLQGGTFGMGRLYTATEWLEQAVDWNDSDGFWEDEEERNRFIFNWKVEIMCGNEETLIHYIENVWELEIVEGNLEEGIPEEYNLW